MIQVNGRQQSLVLLVHGVIACVLIAAATFLSYSHDLDGQSLAVILGGALGLVGGSAGSYAILSLSNGHSSNGTAQATPTAAPSVQAAPAPSDPPAPNVVQLPTPTPPAA